MSHSRQQVAGLQTELTESRGHLDAADARVKTVVAAKEEVSVHTRLDVHSIRMRFTCVNSILRIFLVSHIHSASKSPNSLLHYRISMLPGLCRTSRPKAHRCSRLAGLRPVGVC